MKPLPLTVLFAAAITSTSLNAQEARTDSSLWSMIQQGGWAMYPLAACSLAMIYIGIHCYRETRPGTFAPTSLINQLAKLLATSDFEQASTLALSSNSVLGRAIARALPKLGTGKEEGDLEAFETEIGSALGDEENTIAQWTHYLSVVANVAPMIGLLGTVSGMIGGFQTMASGGMGRPELFAGDIGEALITTATGLCIGIPAMVAHSYFNNRLQTAISTTVKHANTLVDAIPAHIKQGTP